MSAADKHLTQGLLCRVDIRHFNGEEVRVADAYKSIVKTMVYLGFFDDAQKLTTKCAKGKPRASLDCFGDVMAEKLKLRDIDRDLVVMRHNFVIEDANKNQWKHTSTMM